MGSPPLDPGPPLRTYENVLQAFRDGVFMRTTRHVPLGTPAADRHTVEARQVDRLRATGIVSRPEADEPFAWLVGRRPVVTVDVVHAADRRLVLRIAGPGEVAQSCLVRFNDHLVGRAELPVDGRFVKLAYDVPAEVQQVGRNTVELFFEQTHPRRLDGAGPTLAVAGRLRHVVLLEEGVERRGGPFEAGLASSADGTVGAPVLRLPADALASVSLALPRAERAVLRYTVRRADVGYEVWLMDEQGRSDRMSSGRPGDELVIVEHDLSPWLGTSVRLSIRTDRSPAGFVEIGPAVVLAGGTGTGAGGTAGDGVADTMTTPRGVTGGHANGRTAGAQVVQAQAGAGPPSFLVVVLDGLARDRVSAYGHDRWTTPNLDALIAEGRSYSDATAPGSTTAVTTASLLSGRSLARTARLRGRRQGEGAGDDSGTLTAGAAPQTLATTLAALGWETAALVADAEAAGVVARDQGFALVEEFHADADTDTDAHARAHGGTVGERVVGRARDLLEQFGDRPFLLYVHLPGPGAPYGNDTVELKGVSHYDGPVTGDAEWLDAYRRGEVLADWRGLVHLGELYDARTVALDAVLGRLLLLLQWSGRDVDTVVVVTSAHGESFGGRNVIGHGETVQDSQLAVPLVLRGPGVAPGRSRGLATHADVLPTLLGLATIALPRGVDGAGLLSGERPDRGLASRSAGPDPAVSWTRDGLRLIVDTATRRRELYDLSTTLADRVDLSRQRPITTARMERELLDELSAGGAEPGIATTLRASLRRP